MYQLVIGNKNYSSWSMRPWVLLRALGIGFDELRLRFDGFGADSAFKRDLQRYGGAGRVPLLLDGDLAVWDSAAIAEYLHEDHPAVWPAERRARAQARSACAEMHSGFQALRQHCPMNIEATLHEVGAAIWREQPQVRADLERIAQLWSAALHAHGGPMLYGEFSYADACFAPVCMRVRSYGLPLDDTAQAYVQRVCQLPAVAQWIAEACSEHDFLDWAEPYRQAPPRA